jgi:hypothetical protein
MINQKERFTKLKQRRKKLKEMANRGNKKDPLMECTMEQLRSLARELRLKGFSRLDKGDLVSFLVDKVAPASLLARLRSTENHSPTVKDDGDAFASPAPATKERKGKRFSYIGNWASILGFVLAVIGPVVPSTWDKKLNDRIDKLETRIDKLETDNPITRDKVIKEKTIRRHSNNTSHRKIPEIPRRTFPRSRKNFQTPRKVAAPPRKRSLKRGRWTVWE